MNDNNLEIPDDASRTRSFVKFSRASTEAVAPRRALSLMEGKTRAEEAGLIRNVRSEEEITHGNHREDLCRDAVPVNAPRAHTSAAGRYGTANSSGLYKKATGRMPWPNGRAEVCAPEGCPHSVRRNGVTAVCGVRRLSGFSLNRWSRVIARHSNFSSRRCDQRSHRRRIHTTSAWPRTSMCRSRGVNFSFGGLSNRPFVRPVIRRFAGMLRDTIL